VYSHRELLRKVWGPDYGSETTYLRTFIRRLRRKLEPNPTKPRFLLIEPGRGYYMPLPDADENG
jgi:two-component system KDP operon response regulator KdpE